MTDASGRLGRTVADRRRWSDATLRGRRRGLLGLLATLVSLLLLVSLVPAGASDTDVAPAGTAEADETTETGGDPGADPTVAPATEEEGPPSGATGRIPELNLYPFGNTEMGVSWSAPFARGAVVEYLLYRDEALVHRNPGDSLSYRDTGLTAATRYAYQVFARDGAGNLSESQVVSATTGTRAPFENGAVVPSFAPSGIDGAGFQNVIAINPFSPEKLLVGGDVAGVSYSKNRGEQWRTGNEGLWKEQQLHIGDVEWSPTVRDKGYMCSSYKGSAGGFFVTTDAGQSWRLQNDAAACYGGLVRDTNMPYPHPRSIGNLMAIDKDSGNIYLATYNRGVMRSTDDGKTWTTLGLSGKYLRGLVLDPNNPNVVYVAVYNEGVYATTTARAAGSFTKLANSTRTPEELAIVGSVLWVAAGPNGIFKGTGSGTNRTFSRANLPTGGETAFYSVAGHQPANGAATLYVGTFQGPKVGSQNQYDNIYKSTDGGSSWRSITRDASKINYVPWGGSEPWWLMATKSSFAPGKNAYVASQIAIDPSNPQRIYSAGRSGVWRSDDGGEHWRPAVKGIGATITRASGVAVAGNQVFVALADYVLVQSTNNGETFTQKAPPGGNVGYGVAVDSRRANPKVYVAVGERDANTDGDVWRNDNPFGNGSWVSEGLGNATGRKRVMGVGFIPRPNDGRVLLAAVDGGGLWRKENDGGWTKVSSEISGNAANGGNTKRVVRGASLTGQIVYMYDPTRGVYRSKDTGRTWTKIWNKATSGNFAGFMTVDPNNAGTLYVSAGDSVYRIDGAENGSVGNGLNPVDLRVPNPGPLYVSSDGALWTVQQVSGQSTPAALLRSTDRGGSWTRVDDPTWRGTVATATSLAILNDEANPAESRAFVTLDGSGMLVGSMVREGNPGDLDPPATVIEAPSDGDTFAAAAPVTVSGTATDNVGVSSVNVYVYSYQQQQYLQPDGSFGPDVTRLPASLGTPGGRSTTWTLSVTLPPGDYATTAQARDAAGNGTNNLVVQDFSVLGSGGGSDGAAPTVAVTAPTANQELPGGQPVVMTGQASDDVAVAEVTVALQRTSDNKWLLADGGWGSKTLLPAVLDAPGTTGTGWTFSRTLPEGTYRMQAQATDGAGRTSPLTSLRTFGVAGGTAPDTTAPTVAVSVPVDAQEFAGGSRVAMSGTAADDVGVTSVGVAVQRRSDKRWLQADGTWGDYLQQQATLSAAGSANTNWVLSVTLPPGDYGVQTQARDAAKNRSEMSAWRTFVVTEAPAPDTTAPSSAVTVPTDGQQFPASTAAELTGTATDDVGVTWLGVAVQRRSDKQWLRPDGSWGPYVLQPATLAAAGAATTTWTFPVDLPEGDYGVQTQARDAAGNRGELSEWRTFRVVTPDRVAPTVTVTVPAATQQFPAGPVWVVGTASDDVGVTGVVVAVQRANDGAWLQPDGSWSATRAAVPAVVGFPDSQNTNWYAPLDLAAGSYELTATVTDAARNPSADVTPIPFTVN